METATKIVPSLTADLVNYVRSHLVAKIAKGAKPIGQYRGGDIYHLGDLGVGYVVLVHNGKVAYFVRHKLVKYNELRLGRQVLLWRDPSEDSIADGFAQRIFFGYLINKYTALISDAEQTPNGKRFWENAIQGAFARGLYTYCLDRSSHHPSILTPIIDHEDLERLAPVLWGSSNRHLFTFAVISTKPLSIPTKSILS